MKNYLAIAFSILALLGVGYLATHSNAVSYGATANAGANALYEQSLAQPLGTADTNMYVTSGADVQGNLLPLNSYQCLSVDTGQPNFEAICGTVTTSGTSGLTLSVSLRGLSTQTATTSNASYIFTHRRGADVRITDFPALTVVNNQLNGIQTIPFPIFYSSNFTPSYWGTAASNTLVTLGQAAAIAAGGCGNSSETVSGCSQLATAAQATAGTSAGSTGARLVLPGSLANATPSATTIVPITSTLGKLAQGFLDLTAQWIFSNLVGTNFSATNSTTTNATTTSQYIKGILSSLLKTDSAGQVKGATYGVDYAPQHITYATSTAITAASNAFATSTGIGIPAGVMTASSTIRATVAVSCVAGSTCTLLLRTATGSTVGGSCDFSANASNGGAVFGATGVGFVNIIVYMTNATNAETWQCQTSLSDNIGNVTGPTYSRTNIQNSFGSASVDLSGSNTLQLVIRGNSSTATLQNALIEVNP